MKYILVTQLDDEAVPDLFVADTLDKVYDEICTIIKCYEPHVLTCNDEDDEYDEDILHDFINEKESTCNVLELNEFNETTKIDDCVIEEAVDALLEKEFNDSKDEFIAESNEERYRQEVFNE